MSKQFRNAYVIERGKLNDVSALEPYAEKIIYILKGDEQDAEIVEAIKNNYYGFTPSLDVIIPTGRVISSFIFGFLLNSWIEISIGVYRNKDYTFLKVQL